MFQQDLTSIKVNNFKPQALRFSQNLQLNITALSIIPQLYTSNACRDIAIYGEPGSGCTTLTQGICQLLLQDGCVQKSEILFISVNCDSNEASLWKLMSTKAKEKQDKDTASLLLKPHLLKEKKFGALKDFVKKNYKIVCIDDASLDDNITSLTLTKALGKTSAMVVTVHNSPLKEPDKSKSKADKVLSIHLQGVKEATALEILAQALGPVTLDKEQISKVCKLFRNNPSALKLIGKFICSSFQESSQGVEISSIPGISPDKGFIENSAISRVLEFIFSQSNKDESCIHLLYQLASLRRPLPLKTLDDNIQALIGLSLLSIRREGSLHIISLPQCFQKCLKPSSEVGDAPFDVLQCWLSLLTEKLQQLISDAEDNAWPFIPEKWQYVQKVGAEENYNIKELITSPNATMTSLTELDILQECLYHAYIQKEYSKLAALAFVLDRFLYWQGSAETTLQVLELLQHSSPETAIAPQLLIRKARVMKNTGNLQGAEEALDRMLINKSEIGQWKYRDEKDHHLTSGVCVQIKGDIQYTLGNWGEAAKLLVCSVELFDSLPEPDKKGLSASHGLLSVCLRNMTMSDYASLVQSLGLLNVHPLLAAYFSAKEASRLSAYTPMFFLRHVCQAGEIMLEFSKLAADAELKRRLLHVAIEDMKDSIQAHQTYASLTSREQFYLLVCAMYKLSLAYMELATFEDQKRGYTLKILSMALYEHYCSFNEQIIVDKQIVQLVSECLKVLDLGEFSQENLPNAGEILFSYCEARALTRAANNTSLTHMSLLVKAQNAVPKGYRQIIQKYWSKQTLVEESEKKIDPQKLEAASMTPLVTPTSVTSVVTQSGGVNVTPTSVTSVVSHKVHVVTPSGKTVDRSAETMEEGVTRLVGEDCVTGDQNPVTSELVPPTIPCDALVMPPTGNDGMKQATNTNVTHSGTNNVTPDPNNVKSTELVVENVSGVQISIDCKDHTSSTEAIPDDKRPMNNKKGDSVTASGSAVTEDSVTNENHQNKNKLENCVMSDRSAVTEDCVTSDTVDRAAVTVGVTVEPVADQSVVTQSLEDDVAPLPRQSRSVTQPVAAVERDLSRLNLKAKRVRDAVLWKYELSSTGGSRWRGQTTLAYIGEPLTLGKGKKGAQRDPLTVEFINQDEPMARYVAKRYRKDKPIKQYQQDVLCQMTARSYVAMFNQKLFQLDSGANLGDIQFLPVALLQLVSPTGHVTDVYNIEPYMSGEFTKFTNNFDYVTRGNRAINLMLAFSHFSHQASNGKLIIVDIQGWTPDESRGCTFLTDPQIHSPVYGCFGTGNWKQVGIDKFFAKMHPQCNAICRMLNLVRPDKPVYEHYYRGLFNW